jgi:transmembrane sensor
MKHDPYSLTELIRNEAFIAWVMHPDELSDRKWRAFLDKHPGKRKTVESAREYVILLAKDTGRHQPTQKQSDRMWSIVESQMHEDVQKVPEQEPVSRFQNEPRAGMALGTRCSVGGADPEYRLGELLVLL